MAYNNLIRANDPMAINMLKENLAHFENILHICKQLMTITKQTVQW